MRSPIFILGAAAVVLAASTAWLAVKLHAAREELSVLRAESKVAPEPSGSALPAVTLEAAATAGTPVPKSLEINQPPPSAGEKTEDMRKLVRASLEAQFPRLQETLEDPAKRAQYLRDSRASLHRDMPRLDAYLKLSRDEYEQLLDLLARQDLRYQQSLYDCALDPACDPLPASGYRHEQENKRELDGLLGSDKAQSFANYRDNWLERRAVTQMRGELPDSLRLTDTQADKLIDMLGEERRRIFREWQQEGGGGTGMSNQYGFVSYSASVQSVEEFSAQAGELQRRQRERAAQFLSVGQLEAFTQQQKYALDLARGGWEYQRERARQATN